MIRRGSLVRIQPDPPRSSWGCSSAGRAPALQAGGHRFDPVHLHQRARTGKPFAMVYQCDRVIGCRSLTIHRVESASSTESIERLAKPSAQRAVPSMTLDCVTRLRLSNESEERHNANTQSIARSRVTVLDDACTARRQSYRVKRLSACGGCLGDYRRRRTR